jgi:thioredoxin reductase
MQTSVKGHFVVGDVARINGTVTSGQFTNNHYKQAEQNKIIDA